MIINLDFSVDLDEVRRYLGYQPGKTEDSVAVDNLLLETQAAIGRAARPRGRYRTFPLLKSSATELYLPTGGLRLASSNLAALWQQAEQVSLLAVTLGPKVDSFIASLLAQERYAQAAIADAIGSAAAEAAMEQLNNLLAQEVTASGMTLTRRFSPGYGDVPLQVQEQLGQALGVSDLGIVVTANFLLIPRKSITAMVGWQLAGQAVCQPAKNCDLCNMENCSYKR
ncbi:MAG: hypothetical protein GX060_02320 [Firmicutes bacterium]|nr:hypothetical protein [Bacillota bacterium]